MPVDDGSIRIIKELKTDFDRLARYIVSYLNDARLARET